MIGALRSLIEKWDGISQKRLLWINAGLASLVGISHGGALAIEMSKPSHDADTIRQLATVSLPIAGAVLLSALTALFREKSRRAVLGAHGIAFCVGIAAMLAWAVKILFTGLPEGNFKWGVGLLTVSVGYSVFVATRFALPPELLSRPFIRHAPVAAMAIAAIVDVGVFLRVVGAIGAIFGSAANGTN